MKLNLLIGAIFSLIYFSPPHKCTGQQKGPNVFLTEVKSEGQRASAPSNIIQNYLKAGKHDSFILTKQANATQRSTAGYVEEYQQYYKGVKVDHGIVHLHFKEGVLKIISGEHYELGELSISPSISEETALAYALQFISAHKYSWQVNNSSLPKGELVICKAQLGSNKRKNVLAYKFDIHAVEPLRREYVYVDAQTGEVVLLDSILKHADGLADTRYNGKRTIQTSKINGKYVLRDSTRGSGIETLNLNKAYYAEMNTVFEDDDNYWSSAEYHNKQKDDAALDAHFGAMQTYDYFKAKHNRNSFDGNGSKIKNYVHYGYYSTQAFWDGNAFFFGDGDDQIGPLTSLDIVAHEIGHAICQNTAKLVYANESGAINEGLSDIWGACVEYYTNPDKATWLVGEDTKRTVRSMSNPAEFGHPDTYKGKNWFTENWDNGGVHTNSSIINHWFYILTVGKSGTNDHGFHYNVKGIGIEKAAQIVYRTEALYLTPNSQYKDVRKFSIQAAKDLFGKESNEAKQTANAWDAVGLYYMINTPTSLQLSTTPNNNVLLQWEDKSEDEKGFIIERATVSSDFTVIDTVHLNCTSYVDKKVATNETYFYRVKAFNSKSISEYSNVVHIPVGPAAPTVLLMQDTTLAICDATLLDAGSLGNYPNDTYMVMKLHPAKEGHRLSLVFSDFHTENYRDHLMIYDGPDQSYPIIGGFAGDVVPSRIIASHPSGQLTLVFYSDINNSYSGFKAKISCLDASLPPSAPSDLKASSVSTHVTLNWKDNAYNENGFIVKRSLQPDSNYVTLDTVFINTTSYEDRTPAPNTTYYYRVQAYHDKAASLYSNVISVQTGNSPIAMKDTTIYTCNNLFLDPGGHNPYPAYQTNVTTFYPATEGKRIQAAFQRFDVYSYDDKLYVYDGPDTNAALIFDGPRHYYPDTLAAYNSTGALTFKFEAGSNTYNNSGWVASVRCIDNPPAMPTNVNASVDSSNMATITWTDNSNDEDGFIIERSPNEQDFYPLARVSANITNYVDPYIYAGSRVYYRVRSFNKKGGKSKPSAYYKLFVPIALFDAPYFDTYCEEVRFQDPGAFGNYPNNDTTKLTIYPGWDYNEMLSIQFTLFDTEEGHDFLMIYDGAETTSESLIGAFSGNTLPPVMTTSGKGRGLTLVFITDEKGTRPGWEAIINCVSSTSNTAALANQRLQNTVEKTIGMERQIKVYPNPASSSFKIQLPPTNEKWKSIEVVDLLGQRRTLFKGEIADELEVDASILNKGLNILQIRSETTIINKKVLIK